MNLTNLDKVLGAVAALLVYITPFVKAYIQTKFTPQKLAHVTDLAGIAVRAAEQAGMSNGIKVAFASRYLKDAAKRLGFKLTDEEVRGFIEAAVDALKKAENLHPVRNAA